MIKIGIVGMGYWGPNLYRNFDSSKDFLVKYICDRDLKLLKKISVSNKFTSKVNNYKKIINDSDIQAVVIATPVSTHYLLAKECLEAGKHVFVEKPLADSSKKCQNLINIAKKNSLTIFVDHTFLYTSAVNKMKEIASKKDFGNLLYYDSTRINLGLIQNDINVMWDLAVHDLAILNFIENRKPKIVSAVGHKHFRSKPVTSAYLTIKYDNNFVAHINVNWLSPVKIRQTILGGSKKMILYNDLEPSDKIKVFNKGVDVIKNENSPSNLVEYKVGDTFLPNLKNTEALKTTVLEFKKMIHNKKYKSRSTGQNGMDVVKLLEAADKSMVNNGRPVKV
jgi:predicted dehydrogenase